MSASSKEMEIIKQLSKSLITAKLLFIIFKELNFFSKKKPVHELQWELEEILKYYEALKSRGYSEKELKALIETSENKDNYDIEEFINLQNIPILLTYFLYKRTGKLYTISEFTITGDKVELVATLNNKKYTFNFSLEDIKKILLQLKEDIKNVKISIKNHEIVIFDEDENFKIYKK